MASRLGATRLGLLGADPLPKYLHTLFFDPVLLPAGTLRCLWGLTLGCCCLSPTICRCYLTAHGPSVRVFHQPSRSRDPCSTPKSLDELECPVLPLQVLLANPGTLTEAECKQESNRSWKREHVFQVSTSRSPHGLSHGLSRRVGRVRMVAASTKAPERSALGWEACFSSPSSLH